MIFEVRSHQTDTLKDGDGVSQGGRGAEEVRDTVDKDTGRNSRRFLI